MSTETLKVIGPEEARELLRRTGLVVPALEDLGNGQAPNLQAAEPFHLDVPTLRQVCELPDPPGGDEFLGDLMRRRQRTVVGASTGNGKSTFELQALRASTEGREFLGWMGTGGHGLVIDAEQGLRTVKRQARERQLHESDAIDYIRVPDGLSLDRDPRQRAEVERILAAGSYDVVETAPLYKLHSGDSNSEREAVDLMRTFDGWRELYGFAHLLEVHCRKPLPGTKFTMHEFFGSSAYLRGAEIVVGIQLVRPGYSRLHFFKDRDGDLPVGSAWGLLFDREGGFRRDPEDGKPRKTAADKIRALLEADPGMTQEQLEKATGNAERTVRDALKTLGATERLGPRGLKSWTLPGMES